MNRLPRPAPMIWMYHSVGGTEDDPHQITVSPARLGRQLDWLCGRGLRGITVAELVRAQRASRARGLVGLTFDDGYADFVSDAVPALRRRGFSATVFVVAGRIGADNGWDTGPRKALMTGRQLRWAAEQGMEIGSHGLHHKRLPQVGAAELRQELSGSREMLQDLTGQKVTGFAYPYGRLGTREVVAVRAAGYDYGCAIWSPELSGVHALPRIHIGERDRALRLGAKQARHAMRCRRWS